MPHPALKLGDGHLSQYGVHTIAMTQAAGRGHRTFDACSVHNGLHTSPRCFRVMKITRQAEVSRWLPHILTVFEECANVWPLRWPVSCNYMMCRRRLLTCLSNAASPIKLGLIAVRSSPRRQFVAGYLRSEQRHIISSPAFLLKDEIARASTTISEMKCCTWRSFVYKRAEVLIEL